MIYIRLEDLAKKYNVSVHYISLWMKMCENLSGVCDQPPKRYNKYQIFIL